MGTKKSHPIDALRQGGPLSTLITASKTNIPCHSQPKLGKRSKTDSSNGKKKNLGQDWGGLRQTNKVSPRGEKVREESRCQKKTLIWGVQQGGGDSADPLKGRAERNQKGGKKVPGGQRHVGKNCARKQKKPGNVPRLLEMPPGGKPGNSLSNGHGGKGESWEKKTWRGGAKSDQAFEGVHRSPEGFPHWEKKGRMWRTGTGKKVPKKGKEC